MLELRPVNSRTCLRSPCQRQSLLDKVRAQLLSLVLQWRSRVSLINRTCRPGHSPDLPRSAKLAPTDVPMVARVKRPGPFRDSLIHSRRSRSSQFLFTFIRARYAARASPETGPNLAENFFSYSWKVGFPLERPSKFRSRKIVVPLSTALSQRKIDWRCRLRKVGIPLVGGPNSVKNAKTGAVGLRLTAIMSSSTLQPHAGR